MPRIVSSQFPTALIVSLLLCSCNHYYYVPTMQNVPLFHQKEEVRLNVSDGNAGTTSGTEVQAAVAVSKHIGVMVNASSYHGEDSYYGFYSGSPYGGSNKGHGELIEVGAGYYKVLSRHILVEGYGGIGKGAMEHTYPQGATQARFIRGFLQPAIGVASRNLDLAFSTRFCMLGHGPVEFSPEMVEEGRAEVHQLAAGRTRFLIEPAITVRIGFRAVKLQAQYVHAYNMSSPLPMADNIVSLGIQLNINSFFKTRAFR